MNVLATQRGSRHYPSMLEDVEAHRPTEIEHITGALVREAERLGVPVPLHTAALPARAGARGVVGTRLTACPGVRLEYPVRRPGFSNRGGFSETCD